MDAIGARDLTWSAGEGDISCLPQSGNFNDDDDDDGGMAVPCQAPTVPLAEELEVTASRMSRVSTLAAAGSLGLAQLVCDICSKHAARKSHAVPRRDSVSAGANGGGANQSRIPRLPPPMFPPPFDDQIPEDTIVVRDRKSVV